MKRLAVKIALITLGVIIYLNIGYLVAYSLDAKTELTIASNAVYNILDPYHLMEVQKANNAFYFFNIFFWPIQVALYWGVTFFYFIYSTFPWLFNGALLRNLGLIY